MANINVNLVHINVMNAMANGDLIGSLIMFIKICKLLLDVEASSSSRLVVVRHHKFFMLFIGSFKGFLLW